MMISKVIALVLFLSTNISASASQTPLREQGKYLGYEHLSQKIRSRLFHRTDRFDLSYYLNGDSGLAKFLGAYEVENGVSKKANSDPNGVNIVLYYLVFYGLATDLSKHCDDIPLDVTNDDFKFSLNSSAASILDTICTWPKPSAKDVRELRRLWYLIMGFEINESEFVAWKEFVLSNPEVKSKDAVFEMLLSLFLNPHYLLEK